MLIFLISFCACAGEPYTTCGQLHSPSNAIGKVIPTASANNNLQDYKVTHLANAATAVADGASSAAAIASEATGAKVDATMIYGGSAAAVLLVLVLFVCRKKTSMVDATTNADEMPKVTSIVHENGNSETPMKQQGAPALPAKQPRDSPFFGMLGEKLVGIVTSLRGPTNMQVKAATKIQAIFRGVRARRSYKKEKALKTWRPQFSARFTGWMSRFGKR